MIRDFHTICEYSIVPSMHPAASITNTQMKEKAKSPKRAPTTSLSRMSGHAHVRSYNFFPVKRVNPAPLPPLGKTDPSKQKNTMPPKAVTPPAIDANQAALHRMSVAVKLDSPHTYDLVLDIETAGLNTSGAPAILSIGAARIDVGHSAKTGDKIDKKDMFYAKIPVDSYAHNDNYTITVSTMLWWRNQSPEAIAAAFTPGTGYTSIRDALVAFNAWYRDRFTFSDPKVWTRDPSFDCVITTKAYNIEGIEVPWKFWNEASIRTLQHLTRGTSYTRIKAPVPHHALADVVGDAITVRSMLRLLRDSQHRYLLEVNGMKTPDATSSSAHVDRNGIAKESFNIDEHTGDPSASASADGKSEEEENEEGKLTIEDFEDCAGALVTAAKTFDHLLAESRTIGRVIGMKEGALRASGASQEDIDAFHDKNQDARAKVRHAASAMHRTIESSRKRSTPDPPPMTGNGKEEEEEEEDSDSGSTDVSGSDSDSESSSDDDDDDVDTSDSGSESSEPDPKKAKMEVHSE